MTADLPEAPGTSAARRASDAPSPWRWRARGLAALWGVVVLGLVVVPGCLENNCAPSTAFYGQKPGEGRLVDENTWESGPVDGKWIEFPRQRFWDFDLHDLGDREPRLILPYVSANPNPLSTGDNFVLGSGNLTEISAATKGRIVIHNGTCADYYLRLVVVTAPAAPTLAEAGAEAGPDASADASADASDAGR